MTPSDVPRDYNVWPDMWNDGRGYEPIVLSRRILDNGMAMILISLSPGVLISATLQTGVEAEVKAALEAVKALGAQGRRPLPPAPESPDQGPAGPIDGGQRGELE